MPGLRWFSRGLRATAARRTSNRDIADELAFHMASRVDDLVARGMSHPAASRQAGLEFGSRDKAAEECREQARFTFLEDFIRDCRHSVRSLRKHPGLIAISVASLSCGIGVNALLFSAVRSVFLSEPSATRSHQLVWVEPAGGNELAFANYHALANTGGFAALAGYRQTPFSLREDAGATRISGLVITPNLFRVLGVTPALGRDVRDDANSAAVDEVVISYGFWQRRFFEDPAVVGRPITINGRTFSIVGILARAHIPLVRLSDPDVYVPASSAVLPGFDGAENPNGLTLLARLHADDGRGRALAALNAFSIDRAEPGQQTQRLRPPRLIAFGSLLLVEGPLAVKVFPVILGLLCALLLLIAAANVAGLLLARAIGQQHELALLSALGAPRRRIMQRIFADSLLLSLLGAIGALVVIVAVMPLLQDIALPAVGTVHMRMQFDWRLAAYAGGLMMVSGMLCGMFPALTATRRDPAQLLRHGVVAGITKRLRLRQALVVAETAATVVLLVAAFLFARTLVRLSLVDTGLDLDHGVVSSIELQPGQRRTDRIVGATDRLLDDVRAIPGVEAAGVAEIIPLTMDLSAARFMREGDTQAGARAMLNSVGPDYFKAIGIHRVAGRDFAAGDRAGTSPVVIVNDAFVSAYFPDGAATGRRIKAGRDAWSEIIGVVGNHSVHNAGEDPPYAQVYYAWAQRPVSSQQRAINVVARTSGVPSTLLRPMQAIAATFEADAPAKTLTLRDVTAFEMGVRLAAVRLLTALGTLGLLLATIGLYGIVNYLVVSQTRELGVRMALGATAPMVLREVLWRGLRLTLWGLGAGLLFSLAGARVIASLLAGLSPADPVSFVGSAAVLILMGVLASYLPARRATRTDPMVVLRQT